MNGSRRLFLQTGATCLTAATAGCLSVLDRDGTDAEWPTHLGDARNSRSVSTAPFRTAPGEDDVTWEYPGESGATGPTTPVVTRDSLFVGVGERLHAVDARTGDREWDRSLSSGSISRPAFGRDTLVVPVHAESADGDDGEWRAHGVDPDDGTTRWTVEDLYGWVLVPHGDQVYAAVAEDSTPRLVALDIEDGSRRWTGPEVVSAFPAVAGENVVFVGPDSAIWALDAGAGERRWHRSLDGRGVAELATDGDRVYAGVEDGVYALDGSDGSVAWHTTVGREPDLDALPVPSVVVTADRVVAHTYERLWGLDRATGEQTWTTDVKKEGVPDGTRLLVGWPVAAGDVLFLPVGHRSDVGVRATGWLEAIDVTDGTDLWNADVLTTAPRFLLAVARDTLYVLTGDQIRAIRPSE